MLGRVPANKAEKFKFRVNKKKKVARLGVRSRCKNICKIRWKFEFGGELAEVRVSTPLLGWEGACKLCFYPVPQTPIPWDT